MYLVKITLGRLGRRQSLKILRAVYNLGSSFLYLYGDLMHKEVHSLVSAGAFTATKRLNKKSRTDFLLWIDNRRQS